MWILILTISYLLVQHCSGIKYIDVPSPYPDTNSNLNPKHSTDEPENIPKKIGTRRYLKPPDIETNSDNNWLFRSNNKPKSHGRQGEEDKDLHIKSKITTLVQQTIHDTERKINAIDHLKEAHRELAPYKMGFILSLIKKSRDVLNELFNVAVKHRDSWKALEQLKIFELIVHTNVDTTNLVRQLVELHILHLNSTSDTSTSARKRVVLI